MEIGFKMYKPNRVQMFLTGLCHVQLEVSLPRPKQERREVKAFTRPGKKELPALAFTQKQKRKKMKNFTHVGNCKCQLL
jgi:hypothetical protein